MKRILITGAFAMLLSLGSAAQEPAAQAATSKGNTVIGCLAGPDSDDHYTLTSMQHRSGVDVVGSEELQKGAGAKVKLTGSWEPEPGSEGKTGDAAKRFRATEITVMAEKCQAPTQVTPVSKKKQAAQKQAEQQAQPK
jgi:hypothetical protein